MDDTKIESYEQLVSPNVVIEKFAASDFANQSVLDLRKQLQNILIQRDDRLIVVVGPCSLHDPESAIEYALLLKKEIENFRDDLCIIMRCYLEKPRTTVGWKGLWSDPDLDNSCKINKGIELARELYVNIAELGVGIATEMLDTITPQFFSDLVSLGAVGARTTESQVHRELSSGLCYPIGFKNGTDGSVDIAIDAIRASGSEHRFLGINKQGIASIVSTKGNKDTMIILRGGRGGTNFDTKSIQNVTEMLKANKLPVRIVVDCSHGNSKKDFTKQPIVAESVAQQIRCGQRGIIGVMIESNIHEGSQSLAPKNKLKYGVSITDSCINFQTTRKIFLLLADAVRKRRMHIQ